MLGDGSDADADFHSSTSFRVEKGKLEIAAGESITNTVQGSASSSSNKSMVGGKGTLDTVTIGTGNNEVDTISPGEGIASSLTATNSQVQASIGNGAASDSIGTFTVTNLTLNNDAVFDWEITDFDGTAGSDWDLLAYDNLVFGNDAQIDINLLVFYPTEMQDQLQEILLQQRLLHLGLRSSMDRVVDPSTGGIMEDLELVK